MSWIGGEPALKRMRMLRGHKRVEIVEEDVFSLIFHHEVSQRVVTLFLQWKRSGRNPTTANMQKWARNLHDGKVRSRFK